MERTRTGLLRRALCLLGLLAAACGRTPTGPRVAPRLEIANVSYLRFVAGPPYDIAGVTVRVITADRTPVTVTVSGPFWGEQARTVAIVSDTTLVEFGLRGPIGRAVPFPDTIQAHAPGIGEAFAVTLR